MRSTATRHQPVVNQIETEMLAQAAEALRRRGLADAAARAEAARYRLLELRRSDDASAA